MRNKFVSASVVCLALGAGIALSQDKGGKGGAKQPAGPGLTLTSPDLEDGAVIPEKFSARASRASTPPSLNSPRLEWTHVPAGTESFILLFHDPDVALQKKLEDVTHWMMFNIPGTATSLPGSIPTDPKLPDGAIQIKNSGNITGYMGPGMGPQGPYHHYTFELYALDTKLDLPESATRADVLKAADGHILGKAVLAGRYHQ